MNEKQKIKVRKNNMKLFPIYQMIGLDLLFFYAIQVLFLTQVKGFSTADIVLGGSFYAFAAIITQIPASVIIGKIGKRNSLILGNSFNFISVLFVIFSRSFTDILIYQFLNAIGFALKGVAEPSILNNSIPEATKKGEIFSNINGKGYSWYCYICAVSAMLSGFLYDVNPYIPLGICLLFLFITVVLSYKFGEIEEAAQGEEVKKETVSVKESIRDIKIGFKFIVKSDRLKSLLLIVGSIWGILCLLGTYEITLMGYVKIPASYMGIILAVMQILVGIASTKSNAFHDKFKNKTLTILGYSCTIGSIVAGGVVLLGISIPIAIILILLTYGIRAASKGVFQVTKQRYLNNFTDEEILPKVYAAHGIIANVLRMIIGLIGSFIIKFVSIPYAMIISGILFSILIAVIAKYMKSRLGLKPQEYPEGDIKYQLVK